MTRFRTVLLLAMAPLLGTSALAESVFRVLVRDDGAVAASGLGVLVADGFLLTGASLIGKGQEALVEDSGSGATIVSEVRNTAPEADLALLSVPSLKGEPIPLALSPSGPGRHVYLRGLEGARREGVFHSEFTNPAEQERYRFTALAGNDEHAAPVLNNCDQLLAISQTLDIEEDAPADARFGESNALSDVVAFLEANKVEHEIADQRCPSLEEQLSEAANSGQRLEEEKTALSEEIKELEQAVSLGTQQRSELEESLDSKRAELAAKQAALDEAVGHRADLKQRIQRTEAERTRFEDDLKRAEEELERVRKELAARERQEETSRRVRWYVGGGVGSALLILAGLLLQRSRKRRSELARTTAELEEARDSLERSNATFRDAILMGTGPDGQEIRIKIIGNSLARAEKGQIIGRSSGHAVYVVAEQSVSRRHALLRASGDEMTIEDLNSLNGTTVNGTVLRPGEAMALPSGSRVTFGDVEFLVEFM